MLRNMRIQPRILLTFTLIVGIGGGLQLFIAGNQLARATLEFFQHHLEKDVLILSSTLAEPLEHYLEEDDRESSQALQNAIGSFQREASYDYVIVDKRMALIAYSANQSLSTSEKLPKTPEFDIRPFERTGTDTRLDTKNILRLYVASEIMYENKPIGYLVLSKPMESAQAEVIQRWVTLAMTTLPVFSLVFLASWWVADTIASPLKALRDSAVKIAQGQLETRVITHSRDEVGELSTTLNDMAEQLEELLKTQRRFVSNAAHELRTPLMTLQLRADALLDSTLSEADRALYLQEISQEIQHMAKLVASLLSLARLDEGRILTAEHSDGETVSALCRDLVRHWRIHAHQKSLTLETHIAEILPSVPLGVNDLRVVLDNLLGNAIKYTNSGKISLTVKSEENRLIVTVQDSGIGFTSTQKEQLFLRFYRSEQARTQAQGTGLGLAITKAILQRVGASLKAESAGLGHGATFTIRF